ncbi:aldehyde dehydrogenase family protein [Calycomorphotria hydatis]|nr:aldehyde dehydrogenase family protein [Calycomorphotria hydatis]
MSSLARKLEFPETQALTNAEVRELLSSARQKQAAWSAKPLKERLKVVRKFRHRIAERPDDFTYSVETPQRRNRAETLASELLPLADACQFLEQTAPKLLNPKKLSTKLRPSWLSGVTVEERREPYGVVLIIGTWNYPLFLPGVQTLQALAAGNAVILKPGRHSHAAAMVLKDALVENGLDPDLFVVLPEDPAAAQSIISPGDVRGADKVILTGSAETGRTVLGQLADELTPAAMELSGCDAVYVRGDADLKLVVDCLSLGMTFNGSATCIAPRRVLVHEAIADELEDALAARFPKLPPAPVDAGIAAKLKSLLKQAEQQGAEVICGGIESTESGASVQPVLVADAKPDMELLKSDVFAPVLSLVPVAHDAEALAVDRKCPYALGATVFGGETAALKLAAQIDAGCVVVNDFLIPTADPRVSFGGRKESGFGVTRGAEGLLAMTQLKTVTIQRSNWRPHLTPPDDSYEQFFKDYIASIHAPSAVQRIKAGWRFLQTAIKKQREK